MKTLRIFLTITFLFLTQAHAILGGTLVPEGSHLRKSTVFVYSSVSGCTGSVIAAQVILTAAHCVSKTPDHPAVTSDEPVIIYGGNIDGTPIDQELTFKQRGRDVFVHPRYSGLLNDGKLSGKLNDIALIRLSRPINGAMEVAKLADFQMKDSNGSATVAGYGPTAEDIPNNFFLLRMLKSDIKIYDANGSGQLIMTPKQPGTGIILGDSGGPAVANVGGILAIIGIASIGQTDSSVMTYEQVGQHLDWIRATIEGMDF